MLISLRPVRAACYAAVLLMVSPAGVVLGQTADDALQTWSVDSGSTVQAKFINMNGGNVVLQKADGQQVSVPYAKLSLSSQFRVKKLTDPKAFEAPPLPSSYAPPPIADNPFPADPTIEQFLDTFTSQLKAGKPEVVWYALPPQTRSDVEALVTKGADVLGPKTFKQMQVVLPNLLTLIRDKRSFIVGSPSIARQPEIAKSVNQVLPAIEPMVELFTQPSTWNSENFKEGRVASWLMLFAGDTVKAAEKMQAAIRPMVQAQSGQLPPDLTKFTYKVLEKTADSAKVEFSFEKAPKRTVTFKKMESSWLPQEAEEGLSQLTLAKAYLDGMDKAAIDELRSSMRTGLMMANGFLGPLANAKTQQEFSAAFEPLAAPVIQQMQSAIARQTSMGQGGMQGMSPGMSPGMGSMPMPAP